MCIGPTSRQDRGLPVGSSWLLCIRQDASCRASLRLEGQFYMGALLNVTESDFPLTIKWYDNP